MGQYFKIVNIDKKEYLSPWCLDSGAKLWEIAANGTLNPLALLLRQSSEGGGGDIDFKSDIESNIKFYEEKLAAETDPKEIEYYKRNIERAKQRLAAAPDLTKSLIGHWAGDRITIVGDYDDSKLYDTADEYINISHLIIEEFNAFIEVEERKVYPPDYHMCETFRRKEHIEDLKRHMRNYQDGTTHCSEETAKEQIGYYKAEIDRLEAQPFKEPAYKSQKAHLRKLKNGLKEKRRNTAMSPDMIISTGGGIALRR